MAPRCGSRSSWISISAIGPRNACWPHGGCWIWTGGGAVTDGLQRLEVLLRPIYEALKERNPHGDLHQGDETRWRVFVILEGKEGYGWWLWAVLGPDTVVYLLDASRVTRFLKTTFGPIRVAFWWSIGTRPTRR